MLFDHKISPKSFNRQQNSTLINHVNLSTKKKNKKRKLEKQNSEDSLTENDIRELLGHDSISKKSNVKVPQENKKKNKKNKCNNVNQIESFEKNSNSSDKISNDKKNKILKNKKVWNQEITSKNNIDKNKKQEKNEEEPAKKKKKVNKIVQDDEEEINEELYKERLKIKEKENVKCLLVTGLKEGTSEEVVRKWAEDAVDVNMRMRFKRKNSKLSKFYAFIKFESEEKAEQNIEKLRQKKLKGKEVKVDYIGLKNQSGNQNKKLKKLKFDKKKLYVTGFLKDSITEDKLEELFQGCSSVIVPRKRADNKPIGYAFIEYEDRESCKKARSQDYSLEDRQLTVFYANKN